MNLGQSATDIQIYDRACLQPYTVNFKCVFKYFLNIERLCALAWQCLVTARVHAVLATVAETAQV